MPPVAVFVLPCIGSQTQTGMCPAFLTASMCCGRCISTLFAPKRVISVTLPISLLGLTRFKRSTSLSGSVVGPTLIPIGFSMPRMYSICAFSGCLVLSPTHKKWAPVLYHFFSFVLGDGRWRVMLDSYSSNSDSCDTKKSTDLNALLLLPDASAPIVCMKSNASVSCVTIDWYSFRNASERTWLKFQLDGAWRSTLM